MTAPWLAKLREQAIRAVTKEGETVEATAQLLRLAPETVATWCGITPPDDPDESVEPYSAGHRAQVVGFVRAGSTYAAAARAGDVLVSTVVRWCRRARVPSPHGTRARQTTWVGVLIYGTVYERAKRLDEKRVEVCTRRADGTRAVYPWRDVERWRPRLASYRPGNFEWQDGPAARRQEAA